ncbi:MAG TPA: hypothetical protein VEC12_02995 [Bacteroidia bacterium]|nr:hypothetical protein [Bacteroidia bacterium]
MAKNKFPWPVRISILLVVLTFFYILFDIQKTDAPFKIKYSSKWKLTLLNYRETVLPFMLESDGQTSWSKAYGDTIVSFIPNKNGDHKKFISIMAGKSQNEILTAVINSHGFIQDKNKQTIMQLSEGDTMVYSYYFLEGFIVLHN